MEIVAGLRFRINIFCGKNGAVLNPWSPDYVTLSFILALADKKGIDL